MRINSGPSTGSCIRRRRLGWVDFLMFGARRRRVLSCGLLRVLALCCWFDSARCSWSLIFCWFGGLLINFAGRIRLRRPHLSEVRSVRSPELVGGEAEVLVDVDRHQHPGQVSCETATLTKGQVTQKLLGKRQLQTGPADPRPPARCRASVHSPAHPGACRPRN